MSNKTLKIINEYYKTLKKYSLLLFCVFNFIEWLDKEVRRMEKSSRRYDLAGYKNILIYFQSVIEEVNKDVSSNS